MGIELLQNYFMPAINCPTDSKVKSGTSKEAFSKKKGTTDVHL